MTLAPSIPSLVLCLLGDTWKQQGGLSMHSTPMTAHNAMEPKFQNAISKWLLEILPDGVQPVYLTHELAVQEQEHCWP